MMISVIVVSYNVREFVKQCLQSLNRAHFTGQVEIVVVDNDSYDGTAEMVRRQFPEVHLVVNQSNRGFAAAANQGMAASNGEFVLLLNPDTIVEEQTLQVLADYLRAHPEAGCVGPKILNSDGSLQAACKRSFPKPWVALTRLLGLAALFPKSRLFARYNLTYLDPDQTHIVEAVSGSCMCLPRRVLEEIGPMDEAFFLFGEDLDYYYRIGQAGYQVVYHPATQIVHYKGESIKTAPFDNLRAFYEAMEIFSAKYDSLSGGLITRSFIRLGIRLRSWMAYTRSYLATFSSLLIDTGVIGAAFFLMVLVRFLPDPLNRTRDMLINYAPVVAVYVVLWLAIGGLFQIYGRYVLSYSRALIASFIGFLVIATLTYLYQDVAYSRIVLVLASALVAVMLPGWRLVVHVLQAGHRVGDSYRARRPSLFSRRAIIMGSGPESRRIARLLLRRPDKGLDLIGYVDDHPGPEGSLRDILPFLGRTQELRELVRKFRLQEVIVPAERFTTGQLMALLERTRDLHLLFRMVPHQDEVMLGKANVEQFGDVPFVNLEATLYRRFHLLSKRLFDLLASGLLLLTLLLPLPFIFLVYGLERQTVWSVEGQQRRIWLLRRGREGLRRLPLLGSIFKGDLSFVGGELVPITEPDPQLLFKPGITGLTQLRRNASEPEVARSYQHYYLQHQSLTFDVEILLKALFRI
ncbi:MAG: glycosyltransferase [Candidatus Marinimicrobia bacterium]|nr:glycosyltransferase [Candidatus Neomarinimicrobiota bacterium]